MRLCKPSLDKLDASVERPAYPFDDQKCGIVHFGIGAFHRAHQAVYADRAMALGDRDWRIIGVSLRSAAVRDQLGPQDGLYTVTQRSAAPLETAVIGSIAQVLVAPDNPDAVIDALAAPETKIVTLTVTEKGYYQAADGSLIANHGPIAGELADGPPTTIYGYLASALARRRDEGSGGLTLLSCDNLSENGERLRSLLAEFLGASNTGLRDWVLSECTFPSSMVDRIVPATTAEDLAALALRIGMADDGAVFTEPFSQWVIEDNFAAGRPAWDKAGAQLVDDVRLYETAKLRMLNGAHSALAYCGLARGHTFVHQAVADPEVRALIDRLMRREAATSLTSSPGQDLGTYTDALLARFENPALEHRLVQIAMDGSQKIPQRWLETLAFHQAQGRECPALLEALIAWIGFVRGDTHPVDDPMAAQLADLWTRHGAPGIAAALFGAGGLFAGTFTASETTLTTLQTRLMRRDQTHPAHD